MLLKYFSFLVAGAILILGVATQAWSQTDSLADSTKAKADTVHVMAEQVRIKLPSEQERISVLAVGMVLLAGFLVLLVLKKREADREAGIP